MIKHNRSSHSTILLSDFSSPPHHLCRQFSFTSKPCVRMGRSLLRAAHILPSSWFFIDHNLGVENHVSQFQPRFLCVRNGYKWDPWTSSLPFKGGADARGEAPPTRSVQVEPGANQESPRSKMAERQVTNADVQTTHTYKQTHIHIHALAWRHQWS